MSFGSWYSRELCELQNYNPLAPDRIDVKKEMLSNISIGTVKKLVHNYFDKEKYVLHYENLQLYLRLGLKLKKLLYTVTQWKI